MQIDTEFVSKTDTSLAEDLARGSFASVNRLFTQTGAPPPFIQWAPDLRTTGSDLLARFWFTCEPMCDSNGLLQEDRLKLREFGSMRDWLMRVRRLPGDDAFTYLHYGAGIARIYGNDMTGATTRDFQGHISRFFTAVYNAACARRERVLTVHQPPRQVFVSTWRRAAIPVCAADGSVRELLVLNSPENALQPGLEVVPVPVLIVDEETRVRYANKPARIAFDNGAYGPWNRTVFDYAALDLEFHESPERALRHGMPSVRHCHHLQHQRLSSYNAMISPIQHFERAFFLVLLMPQHPA